jgi:hypothetical protein
VDPGCEREEMDLKTNVRMKGGKKRKKRVRERRRLRRCVNGNVNEKVYCLIERRKHEDWYTYTPHGSVHIQKGGIGVASSDRPLGFELGSTPMGKLDANSCMMHDEQAMFSKNCITVLVGLEGLTENDVTIDLSINVKRLLLAQLLPGLGLRGLFLPK